MSHKESREKARAEGREENTITMIKSMLRNGYSNEEISKITGKDDEYIESIRNI